MALPGYLTLKGQKQGDIKGSVTQRGREGSILVLAFTLEIVSPRDSQSGLPTGKRQHKPIVITKEIDRSSPALWTALVNNENMTEFTLGLWAPGTGTHAGQEVQYYTIKLTNASIASIVEFLPDTEDPVQEKFSARENVSFVYQKIEWTWTDGGITATDNWTA